MLSGGEGRRCMCSAGCQEDVHAVCRSFDTERLTGIKSNDTKQNQTKILIWKHAGLSVADFVESLLTRRAVNFSLAFRHCQHFFPLIPVQSPHHTCVSLMCVFLFFRYQTLNYFLGTSSSAVYCLTRSATNPFAWAGIPTWVEGGQSIQTSIFHIRAGQRNGFLGKPGDSKL